MDINVNFFFFRFTVKRRPFFYRLNEITNDPVMETTAWFIIQLRHLFKIMTSRDRLFALSFHKMDMYHTAIEIIRLFIYIFINATFEGDWKVTLTHMIMCLEAILQVQEELLQVELLDFLCYPALARTALKMNFRIFVYSSQSHLLCNVKTA